jgi:hypothetical protein
MDRRQKEEDEEDVSIEEDSDVNKETEGFVIRELERSVGKDGYV